MGELQFSFINDTATDRFSFVSLGSGSCGNCGVLSYGGESIILDAGVGIRKFEKSFNALAIDPSTIRGIFITHDHSDHTRAAARLAHKYQWPIYATPPVARALLYHRMASAELSAYLKWLEIGDIVAIGKMRIRSFEVPHDATSNVGYAVDTPKGRFTLITDIGQVTPTIIKEVQEANYLVFESNYDQAMLLSGRYSFLLKQRITSGLGHISNEEAAALLAEHLSDRIRFLALCHLSGENNSPEKALATHRKALQKNSYIDWEGEGLQLVVLRRGECSPIYTLCP